MRILHLFSNNKWTGPAEPALSLCATLKKLGVEVAFACAPLGAGRINKVLETAQSNGLELLFGLRLSKHRNPLANFLDRRALRAILERQNYDIVHCHLDNDHRIAASPAFRKPVPLVRSSYYGEGFQANRKASARSYGRLLAQTRFLFEPSQSALDYDAMHYGIRAEWTRVLPGTVDTGRFDPSRQVPGGRERLNIPEDAFVVGIVARMQPHRHFEDLWDAVQKLIAQDTGVHVIVIGRGSNQEQVAKRPVRERGLAANVHFPGYLDGDDYVGMLKAFDVKVFLVPGTDGTCRAVREAMAMAKPIVAANRGMLPELVENGQTGFIFDNSADDLFEKLHRLQKDRAEARRMGQAAREKTLADFTLEGQAQTVLEVYESLLA